MSAEIRTADGRILTDVEKVAHEAIAARLSWASLHWGTERVSPEAWPHIAIAVTAAIREQIAREIHDRQMFYTDEPAPSVTQKTLNLVAANYMAEAARIARGQR